MALGARRAQVLRMVVTQGLGLAAAGVALGTAAAAVVTRYLQSLLYGVAPTDPVVLAGASLLLFVVALLACCLPARRPTRGGPRVALRCEWVSGGGRRPGARCPTARRRGRDPRPPAPRGSASRRATHRPRAPRGAAPSPAGPPLRRPALVAALREAARAP